MRMWQLPKFYGRKTLEQTAESKIMKQTPKNYIASAISILEDSDDDFLVPKAIEYLSEASRLICLENNIIDQLKSPDIVWTSMLRGTIAKPNHTQIKLLYPELFSDKK